MVALTEAVETVGRPEVVRRLPVTDAIALTFDDGPDPEFTPRLLNMLRAAGVSATFFVLGRAALEYPALIARMRAEGHTVGSHGWSHRHPWRGPTVAARREVVLAERALTALCGQTPTLFRPPFGRRSPIMEKRMGEGERIILWSRSGIDWGPWGTVRGIARRLQRVRGGDIVLLHDGRHRHNRPEAMLAALPSALATWRAAGLRFETL